MAKSRAGGARKRHAADHVDNGAVMQFHAGAAGYGTIDTRDHALFGIDNRGGIDFDVVEIGS